MSRSDDTVIDVRNPGREPTPLLCRLGCHSTFLDTAFFTSAPYCTRCSRHVGDSERGRRLRRERALWSRVPDGLTSDGKLGWVASRLFDEVAA